LGGWSFGGVEFCGVGVLWGGGGIAVRSTGMPLVYYNARL
jgi:hypothetical protein